MRFPREPVAPPPTDPPPRGWTVLPPLQPSPPRPRRRWLRWGCLTLLLLPLLLCGGLWLGITLAQSRTALPPTRPADFSVHLVADGLRMQRRTTVMLSATVCTALQEDYGGVVRRRWHTCTLTIADLDTLYQVMRTTRLDRQHSTLTQPKPLCFGEGATVVRITIAGQEYGVADQTCRIAWPNGALEQATYDAVRTLIERKLPVHP